MLPEIFDNKVTPQVEQDELQQISPQIVRDYLAEGGRCTPTAKERAGDCLVLGTIEPEFEGLDSSREQESRIREKVLQEIFGEVLSNDTWTFKPSNGKDEFVKIDPICEFIPKHRYSTTDGQSSVKDAAAEFKYQQARLEVERTPKSLIIGIPPVKVTPQKPYDQKPQ